MTDNIRAEILEYLDELMDIPVDELFEDFYDYLLGIQLEIEFNGRRGLEVNYIEIHNLVKEYLEK